MKNKHNQIWSAEEDQIVIQEIGNSAANMKNAFENASRQLHGRTPQAIANHWYTSLSKNKTHLAVVSSNGNVTHNRKIVKVHTNNLSLRNEILKESLTKLSRLQRKEIINFLMDL